MSEVCVQVLERKYFSSILFFGPQSYNSEKPFLQRGKNRSEDGTYICAVGCMCVHLWFYHIWICLQIIHSIFIAVTAQCCSKVLPPKTPSLLIYPFTAGGGVFMLSFPFALARQLGRQVSVPNTHALKMY